jgi:hypothetical protein
MEILQIWMVGVIWVAPSHDHVIVATGFPPCMVHVSVTLLPSIIGPAGVCVIVGDVVGWSKIGWHSDLQYFHYLRNVLWIYCKQYILYMYAIIWRRNINTHSAPCSNFKMGWLYKYILLHTYTIYIAYTRHSK